MATLFKPTDSQSLSLSYLLAHPPTRTSADEARDEYGAVDMREVLTLKADHESRPIYVVRAFHAFFQHVLPCHTKLPPKLTALFHL